MGLSLALRIPAQQGEFRSGVWGNSVGKQEVRQFLVPFSDIRKHFLQHSFESPVELLAQYVSLGVGWGGLEMLHS